MTIALGGLRGRLLTLTAAAVGFLCLPAVADAAYVTRDANTLRIVEDTPGPGGIGGTNVQHVNKITVTFDGDEYIVTDTGGNNPTTDPLAVLDNRCTAAGNTVRCPSTGINRIEVDAGELADIIDLDDPSMPDNLTSRITGGTGADELRGLDGGADEILGQEDGDDLYGNAGNDSLSGGQGDDVLRGGEGDDTLYGGADQDDFHGDGGTDTVDYSTDGTQGVGAVIDPNQPSGFGCLDTPGECEGDQINPSVENLTGTAGDDHLIGSENVGNRLNGLGGNDRLYGLSGGDLLNGDAGDDQLYGASGADTLNGGTGNDRLQGGDDNDTINGGGQAGDTVDYTDRTGANTDNVTVDLGVATATNGGARDGSAGSRDTITGVNNVDSGDGDDVLTGNDNANTFNSGAGDDTLTGKGGNDTFNAGTGNDVMNGNAGDDTFNAGDGDDSMTGEAGNDTFNAGDGDDTMNGGAGGDTFNGGAGERDHVTYADDPDDADDSAGGLKITIGTGVGDDGGTNDGAAGARDTVGADVEDITGGPDNDEIVGSSNDNILHGGAGNDLLDGLGGPDLLFGDAGTNDRVTYATRGADQPVVADLDSEQFDDGGAADGLPGARDTIDGLTVESLIGGAGNDTLTGNGVPNTLSGGGGNDTLRGGLGGDVLNGGEGEDSVIYFDDGRPAGAGVTVTLGDGANDGTSGTEGDNVGADVENLVGTDSSDSLTGNIADNKLFGLGGADTLSGQAGDDILDGGAGAGDVLDGGSDDDLLHMGSQGTESDGADSVNGSTGEDTVTYSTVNVAAPLAVFASQERTKAVRVTLGGGADDGQIEGAENDSVTGVENATGGAGNDELSGTTAANTLDGRGGDDRLTPGPEADDTYLSDTLIGGDGAHDLADYSNRDADDLVITLDGEANDGRGGEGGESDDIRADVEDVTTGDGNDTVTGSTTTANVIRTEGGNDVVETSDTTGDQVFCGAGSDGVTADHRDAVDGCENQEFTSKAQLSVSDAQVTEGTGNGNTNLQFKVTVANGAAGSPVTFQYTTSEGTATDPEDYTHESGQATIPAGATETTINIKVNRDALDEANETLTLTISNPSSNGEIVDATGTGTILDDESAPTVSIADAQVGEGNDGSKTLNLTVSLSGPSSQDVTVKYSTGGGSATAGSDYTAVSGGTVTIPAGQTTASAPVTILGDTRDEADETFDVTLSAPTNATLGDATGTVTITDDDGPPSLSIADNKVIEGNAGTKTLTFTVTLSEVSGKAVTFNYATANDTATAGSDYVAAAGGPVTIPAGSTSATFDVTVNGDTAPEADETFTVTLSNVENATVADGTATGTIEDDDQPGISVADTAANEGDTATFTVTLSQASGRTVTVDYTTVDATATEPADYTKTSGTLTFAPGDTSKKVDVPLTEDALDEADETFTLQLSSPTASTLDDASATGTITDDDAEPSLSVADAGVTEGNSGSANAVFTVTLSAASGKAVTVKYATSNGTATAGSDYTATSGTLTIPAGQTSGEVKVPVAGDAVDEPNETFTLTLTDPANASIGDGTATGTITDDDGTPSVSVADAGVTEGHSGNKDATFAVTLSGASSSAVTVKYATSDGTATAGSDYTATSGTLTIPAGQTSGEVKVPVAGDTADEASETFTLTLTEPANASIGDGTATGTITDDDVTPSLSVAGGEVTEGNDGSRDLTFTITQSEASSADVTVKYATADGTAKAGEDYTATSGTLTIKAGDTSGQVSVPVTGDTAVEADEAFTLVLSEPAGATVADGKGEATGRVLNDDVAPGQPPVVPTITVDDIKVAEGDTGTTAAVFTVTLSAPTTNTVTVKYVTSDGTATSGSDYAITAGTLTFAPGERTKTVSVSIIGDRRDESDEAFALALVDPQNATLAKSAGAALITDDESPRLAPRAVSARTTPSRDRRVPYRFRTDGRLTLPTGVRRSDGCAGKVQVRFKAGSKTISSRRVNLRKDCTFTRSVSFGIKSRLRPGRLKVNVRFLGNAVLLPKSAKTRYVRVVR